MTAARCLVPQVQALCRPTAEDLGPSSVQQPFATIPVPGRPPAGSVRRS